MGARVTAGDELVAILSTAPDQASATSLARGLVDARLAACVQIVPGLTSVYRWKDEVQTDAEVQLVVKTRAARFDEVAAFIRDHHPYDVPEIVALPVAHVSESYHRWALDETP